MSGLGGISEKMTMRTERFPDGRQGDAFPEEKREIPSVTFT